MNEEEKKDILFQIDMQLYNEFNDKIATMNDHLGDIYSLRDIEEVEQAEKEEEIHLLREAIKKQQKEIKELKEDISNMYDKKVVRNILEDECGLSKYEIDELLGE